MSDVVSALVIEVSGNFATVTALSDIPPDVTFVCAILFYLAVHGTLLLPTILCPKTIPT